MTPVNKPRPTGSKKAMPTTTSRKSVSKSPQAAQDRGRAKTVQAEREYVDSRSNSPSSDRSASRSASPAESAKKPDASKVANERPKYHHHPVPQKSVATKRIKVVTAAGVNSRPTARKVPVPSTRINADGTTSGEKTKRRWRSGTVALRDIRRHQSSIDDLIPFQEWKRFLVRQMHECFPQGKSFRITRSTVLAIRSAIESHLVHLFRRIQRVAVSAGRISPSEADVMTERALRNNPKALLSER